MSGSGEKIVDSGEWRVARKVAGRAPSDRLVAVCRPLSNNTSPQRKQVNPALGLVLLALVLLSTVGCANFQFRLPNLAGEDVSKLRAERKQALVAEYELKRNEAIFQAAVARWDQGDARGCEDSLKQLLGRAPQYRDGHLLYSEVCLQRQDFAGARQHIEEVLAQKPDDAEALHAMGTVLDVAGERAQAVEFYGRAAKLEPDNEIYAVTYEEITQNPAADAGTAFAEGTGGEGREVSDSLLAAAKTPHVAELLRQASQSIAGGQIDASRQILRQASSLEPQNLQIPLQAALLAIASHQDAVAVAVLTDALHSQASPKLHRLLGVAHYRCGDYAASQVALDSALAANGNDAVAHFLLGHTLRRLGQDQAADQHFEVARHLDPTLAP